MEKLSAVSYQEKPCRWLLEDYTGEAGVGIGKTGRAIGDWLLEDRRSFEN
jgi:hypothetical protein